VKPIAAATQTSGNSPLSACEHRIWRFSANRRPKRRNQMEAVMTKVLRRWRSDRRYRTTLRALSTLTARQLSELGIRPVEINRLAREAARLS
jgi:uncharacterized protein YjiS (DUF1127 family)